MNVYRKLFVKYMSRIQLFGLLVISALVFAVPLWLVGVHFKYINTAQYMLMVLVLVLLFYSIITSRSTIERKIAGIESSAIEDLVHRLNFEDMLSLFSSYFSLKKGDTVKVRNLMGLDCLQMLDLLIEKLKSIDKEYLTDFTYNRKIKELFSLIVTFSFRQGEHLTFQNRLLEVLKETDPPAEHSFSLSWIIVDTIIDIVEKELDARKCFSMKHLLYFLDEESKLVEVFFPSLKDFFMKVVSDNNLRSHCGAEFELTLENVEKRGYLLDLFGEWLWIQLIGGLDFKKASTISDMIPEAHPEKLIRELLMWKAYKYFYIEEKEHCGTEEAIRRAVEGVREEYIKAVERVREEYVWRRFRSTGDRTEEIVERLGFDVEDREFVKGFEELL